MKFRMTFFLCLFALLSQPVYAIKVSGLYQATVSVSDESASRRNPAIKRALIQVLVKLTGDRNISKSSSISALIERPERFVQQFRYRQATNEENQQSQSPQLWVQFDETALNDALRSYGLTIWGKERPSILVWLAHEVNESRRLASFEESPEYLTMLDQRATARGLSLLFPLLDLEDTSRISVSDIWGGFKEPILEASERYQSDVLLTGKVIQVLPTLWESQWSVYIDGQTMSWTSQGELVEIVLEEGIDELADRLASQYANTGSTRVEVIELTVSDVNDLDEYARALSYLESLQSVRTVQVKRVTTDKVMFELISHGGLSAIDQAIALGKTLELVSNSEQLKYRLLPR
jgi:uncharacterized protein